jgi:hypothetical protein
MFSRCVGIVWRQRNMRARENSPFGALLADPSGKAWPPSGKPSPAARGDKLFCLSLVSPSGSLAHPSGYARLVN